MPAQRRMVVALSLALTLSVQVSAAQAPAIQTSTAPAFPHPVYPTDTPLGSQIAALLASPAVSRAHWGIAVTTLAGKPIYGLDEGQLFRPASNAKLFTTVAAMALLGPKRVLYTVVRGAAPDPGGVVAGDLVLAGAGDPAFSTSDIPYLSPAQRKAEGLPARPLDPLQGIDDLAAQIAAHGVKRVSGNIVGSDALWSYEPYPDTWGIDDLNTGDGAPVSALTLNDNTVLLTIHPGAKAGDDAIATLSPPSPSQPASGYTLQMAVRTVAAGEKAAIGVDRAVGSKMVRVFGSVALGAPRSRELPIDDPALFAAAALRDRLLAHGVAVDGFATAQHRLPEDPRGFTAESREPVAHLDYVNNIGAGPVDNPSCDQIVPPGDLPRPCVFPLRLAEHIAAPLADDVTFTLKASQNLHAEMMLRELGGIHGELSLPLLPAPSTTAQGVRVERQFLLNAGLDGDDFLFYDGSGLSSHDLVTPRTVAQLLAFAAKQPWFAQWKAALPVGGVDGTLASRFADSPGAPPSPLKGHVYAKTGTLGESRALSGYLDCASGRQVIFAIFVDNHTPVGSADRTVMDKIVAAIAAAN
jgi:D-alanyl-D-alanine carboxypeptidase/D-alanyl-D-alanine-endopeptidase (penicillin-binding protein 4)